MLEPLDGAIVSAASSSALLPDFHIFIIWPEQVVPLTATHCSLLLTKHGSLQQSHHSFIVCHLFEDELSDNISDATLNNHGAYLPFIWSWLLNLTGLE